MFVIVMIVYINFKFVVIFFIFFFRFLHLGPGQPYSSVSTSAFSALVPDPQGTHANSLLRKATINARRSGKDLRDWIDSLVAR